jgi:hypothetical protein
LEAEYEESEFIHVDWHISGPFGFPEGNQRWNYYGLQGAPSVEFDGYDLQVGGGQNMYPVYAPIVANHLANDLAKLTVFATMVVDGQAGTGTIDATVTIAPGETVANPNECKIRCVVFENNLVVCCDPRGNDDWNTIARDALPDEQLTVSTSGQVQDYDRVFTLNPAWDTDNLHAIVYVQRDTNKRILNAAHTLSLFNLELATLDPVTQVISGGAVPVEWDEEVTYTGATDDDVEVTVDKSALPAGWDAELVHNSITYSDNFTISGMTAGQEEPFLVRVIPGGGNDLGVVTVRCEPVSLPAAGKQVDLNTFWNTPAILLVDDDNGAAHEVAYKNAISDAGYASVTHSVNALGVPTTSNLNIYDAVVWTTGSDETNTIDSSAETEIRNYLDAGGRFFLSSHGFMDERGFNPLSINYLRVASFTLDQGANQGTGLVGDVIGDGLVLNPLAPPFTDRADRINPNTGAVAWLRNQLSNPIALRYDQGTYKTVFMAAAFDGISAIAADPNNQKIVMKRILDWFIPPPATDVNPGTGAAAKIALAQNAPNPFSSTTSLSFVLPKSGPVSLSVYDVSGRLVSTLVNRPMDAGNHQVVWDGRDSGGNTVANGVYMLRLQAGGETLTRDMVRMK